MAPLSTMLTKVNQVKVRLRGCDTWKLSQKVFKGSDAARCCIHCMVTMQESPHDDDDDI